MEPSPLSTSSPPAPTRSCRRPAPDGAMGPATCEAAGMWPGCCPSWSRKAWHPASRMGSRNCETTPRCDVRLGSPGYKETRSWLSLPDLALPVLYAFNPLLSLHFLCFNPLLCALGSVFSRSFVPFSTPVVHISFGRRQALLLWHHSFSTSSLLTVWNQIYFLFFRAPEEHAISTTHLADFLSLT